MERHTEGKAKLGQGQAVAPTNYKCRWEGRKGAKHLIEGILPGNGCD